MELRTLRYFVELVKQNSFTLAGEKMRVTQPTISKMVKALELEAGEPLIVRGARCVELTEAGKIVFAGAVDMLAVERQLRDALSDLECGARGSVRVGVPPLIGPFVAPLIAGFRARYPQVTLHFAEHTSAVLEAMLRDGVLDVAFVQPSGASEGLDRSPVMRERFCLVVPRRSRYAQRRAQAVKLGELAAEAFVLYDESPRLNDTIVAACAQAGFEPAVAVRVSHWDTLAMLVEAGIGLAILPASHANLLATQRFAHVAIHSPEIHWHVDVATRRASYVSKATRAFLDVVHEGAAIESFNCASAAGTCEATASPCPGG